MDRAEFTKDPVAAFIGAIRAAGGPVKLAAICERLAGGDLDLPTVRASWTKATQLRVKQNVHIGLDRQAYRWSDVPRTSPPPAKTPPARTRTDKTADLRALPPGEALTALLAGGVRGPAKTALAEAVRAGLTGTPSGGDDDLRRRLDELSAENAKLERMLRETHHQQVSFRAAQDRQLKIDVMRALAELAMEVEELITSGAEPDIVVERVRISVEDHSLEPIGQAGEQIAFDPARHSPLAGFPDAGSPVSVVRPGYTWHADGEDVLLGKAVVA